MRESWDTPTMCWMQTFTGKVIEVANPRLVDIDILDIAHALSRLCRYGGHVTSWYSVAAHSLAMAMFAETLEDQAMLEALLHDASEAYLGDTISPVRKYLVDHDTNSPLVRASMLETLHQRWTDVIAEKFKLRESVANTVHVLDRLALSAEVPLVFDKVSPAFVMNGIVSEKRDEPELLKMQRFVSTYTEREDQDFRPGSPCSVEMAFLGAFARWERTD